MNNLPSPRTLCALAVACLIWTSAIAESTPVRPDLNELAAGKGWQLFNRSAAMIEGADRTAVRLSGGGGLGLAILDGLMFTEGTIEFDVRGKGAVEESFVGIAFHGMSDTVFDAVYFKPFNFISEDEVKRSRAVQYVSMPDYNWPKLRKRFPGMHERPVSPVPDPAAWFHVRIVVAAGEVSAFVNDGQEPCLSVKLLNSQGRGWVAFWVGNGSDGDFANLQITPQ